MLNDISITKPSSALSRVSQPSLPALSLAWYLYGNLRLLELVRFLGVFELFLIVCHQRACH